MNSEDFATPKVHCREGFDRIRAGLILPPGIEAPLFAAFEEGHRKGDPRLQVKLITEALEYEGWQWPWIEQCAARLVEIGMWPKHWSARFIEPPFNWDKISPYAKIDMLSHALSQATYTTHNLAQILDKDVAVVRTPTLIAARGCDASAYFAERYRPQVEAGDFSNIPPFFPFDTVMVSSMRRYPR